MRQIPWYKRKNNNNLTNHHLKGITFSQNAEPPIKWCFCVICYHLHALLLYEKSGKNLAINCMLLTDSMCQLRACCYSLAHPRFSPTLTCCCEISWFERDTERLWRLMNEAARCVCRVPSRITCAIVSLVFVCARVRMCGCVFFVIVYDKVGANEIPWSCGG